MAGSKTVCSGPWKRNPCENTEILLDIVVDGEQLHVCEECWMRISKTQREWGH